MKNAILIILAIGWAVTSCDVIELNSGVEAPPNNDIIQGPQTTPNDETQYLDFLHGTESKLWEAQGFTIAGISGFQDCRLDDQIELFADGTYQYNGGSILCGAEDSQSQRTGLWSLDFTQGVITFIIDGDEFEAVVSGLDPDGIVLSSSYAGLPVSASYQAL